MDYSRKCSYISNGYYNKGLSLANEGDMTNAAEALKRALQFNKHNTDARNLLGLIYYRIGEAADALVQWVLSLNLQPENNDADRYLDELQRQSGLLDSYGQTLQKFNQALALAQGGSDDLAILQLVRIADQSPDYLRASVLLGLLYLANDQPKKAYKYIQNALRIDKGNSLALRCLEQIKASQKVKPQKRNLKETAADKDTVKEIPAVSEPYKTANALSTVSNILLGILVGAASIIFIFLPIKEASIVREYNEQVIEISEQFNRSKTTIKDLEKTNKTLQEENDTLTESYSTMDAEYQAKLSNFQLLAGALDAYYNDRITECANLYAQIDPEYIKDIPDGSSASAEQCYAVLQNYFTGDGYTRFLELADSALEVGNFDSAIENYKMCILIKPENPEAIYKEGYAYKRAGNQEHADMLFNEVIDNYPDSEYAAKAREQRGL